MTLKHFMSYNSDATGLIQGSIMDTGLFFRDWETYGRLVTGFTYTVDSWTYENVLTKIETEMNDLAVCTCSLRYDFDSDRIILSSSLQTTFNFNIATQRILGFDPVYTNTKIITSSFRPWYVWIATDEERGSDSEVYESQQMYQDRVADSGRSYSVGRASTMFLRDFSYVNEPKENVFDEDALTTAPFTFQTFLNELRKGPTSFVIFNSNDVSSLDYENRDGTYEMVSNASSFNPKRALLNYNDYWNVDLETRLLSRPKQ